jgi:inhibitor of KinA sporulation pathway (predicted exonuclease)
MHGVRLWPSAASLNADLLHWGCADGRRHKAFEDARIRALE